MFAISNFKFCTILMIKVQSKVYILIFPYNFVSFALDIIEILEELAQILIGIEIIM